jgi:hypothetical protein
MRPSTHPERGSALLTVLILMAILTAMVASLLLYANHQRLRAVSAARAQNRQSCAEAGLQFARAYFGRNNYCAGTGTACSNWETYLKTPSVYNPVPATWSTPSGAVQTDTAAALQLAIKTSAFQSAHPELFTDLDNDGKNDVYIYVRDNDDELKPAVSNPLRDNDQNVIVGAICISTTLVPRREDGNPDPDSLVLEAMLSFNSPGTLYYAQAAAGASGDGNTNR